MRRPNFRDFIRTGRAFFFLVARAVSEKSDNRYLITQRCVYIRGKRGGEFEGAMFYISSVCLLILYKPVQTQENIKKIQTIKSKI